MKIDNEALRDVLAETSQKVIAADESLRKSFAGLKVDDILPEVERSMNEMGIGLPDSTLRDYAQHISDRADYEFILQ